MDMKKIILLLSYIFSISAYSQSPNLEWAKAIGTSNASAEMSSGLSVAVDHQGNIYMAGIFTGTKDFDPSPATHNLTASNAANPEMFVSKFDASGNFLWVKHIKGNEAAAITMDADAAGNIFIGGFFTGIVDFDPGTSQYNLQSKGNDDIFIMKITPDGDLAWAYSFGSLGYDEGLSLKVDKTGAVFFTGYFYGTIDFDPGTGTKYLAATGQAWAFLLKLNSAGNLVFAKCFGGAVYCNGSGLDVDNSGNIYITGGFSGKVDSDPGPGTFNITSINDQDAYILKLDSMAAFLWAAQAGGKRADYGTSVAVDALDNVYITGSFNDTIEFNSGPAPVRIKSAGDEDIFIWKLNEAGTYVWAYSLGGAGNDHVYGAKTDASGDVYIFGTFNSTAYLDPFKTYQATAAGGADIFISKIGRFGNLVWAATFQGTGDEAPAAVVVDANYRIYTTGWFSKTVDFDPQAGTANIVCSNTYNAFLQKMNQKPLSVDENKQRILSISPNPVNDLVQIYCGDDESMLHIYNASGQVILEKKIKGTCRIDISALPAGLYFAETSSHSSDAAHARFIKVN
jgi:hypothetical protein